MRRHRLLQARLYRLLAQWGRERGIVESRPRCTLSAPGEGARSLVPDLAFFSTARVGRGSAPRAAARIAPDVVVEILPPDAGFGPEAANAVLYLANGARLVVVVDPARRAVGMHEWLSTAWFVEPESAVGTEFDGLRIDTAALFDGL
ncbi:MAG TPA: Uma2 family endonuclease [Candidatus Acidoferrales bacterium]|nr:Uma2 family endonuclease [Candidatus Acidoferrales bacterium]